MNWYFQALRKYADLSGRSERKEFWYFWLVNLVISLVLGVVEEVTQINPNSEYSVLGSVYALAVLLPTLAVGARRLHDSGRTGWWQLIGLIP